MLAVMPLVPALLDALLVYVLRTWFTGSDRRTGWAAALTDKRRRRR